jgi:hypothetical protein
MILRLSTPGRGPLTFVDASEAGLTVTREAAESAFKPEF